MAASARLPIAPRRRARLRIRYRTTARTRTAWPRLKTYFLQDQNPNSIAPICRADQSRLRVTASLPRPHLFHRCGGHLRLGQRHQTKRCVCDAGFLPERVPVRSAAGQRRRGHEDQSVLHAQCDRPLPGQQLFRTTERFPKLLSTSNGTPFSAVRSFTKAKPASPICIVTLRVNSGFQDYGTFRADTFHQLIYPNTYFGWLSVVPRVGFRGTYYGETRDLGTHYFYSQ